MEMQCIKWLENIWVDYMQLKFLLEILNQENTDLEILFDVKGVESMQDFAHLSDIYDGGDGIVIELR